MKMWHVLACLLVTFSACSSDSVSLEDTSSMFEVRIRFGGDHLTEPPLDIAVLSDTETDSSSPADSGDRDLTELEPLPDASLELPPIFDLLTEDLPQGDVPVQEDVPDGTLDTEEIEQPDLFELEVCQPDCSGRVCGDDGCGNPCGSCPTSYACESGTCVYQPSCGNGACDELESFCNCPGDCASACGDGCCAPEETACICAADCPVSCGDGCCGDGETPVTCLTDCPTTCGDSWCAGSEDVCNCPSDCGGSCGDGTCNCGETEVTCPGDCNPYLPLLRVELRVDNWASNDWYVAWYDPAGDVCEDWNSSASCSWGSYGSASISGDNYGNQNPNWIEISQATPGNGTYRAYAYASMCDNSNNCGMKDIRIYVGGTLVRTMDVDSTDLWVGRTLCMPTGATTWNTAAFVWQGSGSCL